MFTIDERVYGGHVKKALAISEEKGVEDYGSRKVIRVNSGGAVSQSNSGSAG